MVAAGLAGPAEVVAGGVQDNTEGDFVGVYVEVDGCGDGLVDEGVVDSKQAPYFLFGQVRDLSAESTPGPAQRGLDCLVDQFDLPTLRVAGRDLGGGVGVVVQQRGQDPELAGPRPPTLVGGGDGELDQGRQ